MSEVQLSKNYSNTNVVEFSDVANSNEEEFYFEEDVSEIVFTKVFGTRIFSVTKSPNGYWEHEDDYLPFFKILKPTDQNFDGLHLVLGSYDFAFLWLK